MVRFDALKIQLLLKYEIILLQTLLDIVNISKKIMTQ